MKTAASKILLLIPLLVLVLLEACSKKGITPQDKQPGVTFSSKTVTKGTAGIRQAKTAVLSADYAVVGINGKIYKTPVYKTGGNVYTEAIKLDPGSYTLTEFILVHSGASPDSTDDVPVYALPLGGSAYATFVSTPAGFHFNIGSLNKKEIPVEVLQFQAGEEHKFGLDYAYLPNSVLRHQIFAGRFFPADFHNYTGSFYQSQPNGIQAEMPAIFRIDVYRNGNLIKSFNNENATGDYPLDVSYPDDSQITDHYRFDLFLYAKTGNGFGYRLIHRWYFSDDQLLHHSSDGIVHFVVGNGQQQADYVFGPYLNLPEKCTLTVDPGYAPGSKGSYFDGKVENVPAGYKLNSGVYPYWCGTDSVNINLGHTYTMDVFSSLVPDALPAYTRYAGRWNEINWLFNHLNQYPFYDWDILQGAAWMILNDWNGTGHSGVSDANSVVIRMANDARGHADFIPDFGQKAAVIFIPERTRYDEQTPKVQVVFTFIEI